MGDYIERNKVFEMLENASIISDATGDFAGYCTEDIQISNIPAADVAPVVHGKWLDALDNPLPWYEPYPECPNGEARCSICNEILTASDEYPCTGKYCPNCGAKMDG